MSHEIAHTTQSLRRSLTQEHVREHHHTIADILSYDRQVKTMRRWSSVLRSCRRFCPLIWQRDIRVHRQIYILYTSLTVLPYFMIKCKKFIWRKASSPIAGGRWKGDNLQDTDPKTAPRKPSSIIAGTGGSLVKAAIPAPTMAPMKAPRQAPVRNDHVPPGLTRFA